MEANSLATLSLLVYPFFVWVLFLKFRPTEAVALSLLIAEMVLPPYYTLPVSGIFLNKWTIPSLAIFPLLFIYAPANVRGSRPFRGIESIFIFGIVGAFFTWWTNRDPIQYGPVTVLPETVKDFISDTIQFIFDPWGVFFLGRIMFRTSKDLQKLCRLVALSIAAYSLPILYEIKMSPQVNRIIYGYGPAHFEQTLRGGGYRPTVCFPTGLHLASFVLACAIMVVSFTRSGGRVGKIPMKTFCFYLVAVLILCKSTGTIIYAIPFIPLVAFGSARRMQTAAKVLTIFFLVYPALRLSDVIPTQQIADLFGGLSTDRQGSLQYRFNMEQGMFDLTRLRPWWGWGGGYGRSFVHDSVSGETMSVPDGALIISVSTRGLLGFAFYYLPFAYAILRAPRLIRKIRSRSDRLLLSALALNCAIIMFDLIINSSFYPVFMLLLGALYGLPAGMIAEQAAKERALAETHHAVPEPFPAPS